MEVTVFVVFQQWPVEAIVSCFTPEFAQQLIAERGGEWALPIIVTQRVVRGQ